MIEQYSLKLITFACLGWVTCSSTTASAESYAIQSLQGKTEKAELVLHISADSARVYKAEGEPCGYIYTADVFDVLKGGRLNRVEFSAHFSGSNVILGRDTIVFLRKQSDMDEYFDSLSSLEIENSDEDKRLKACHSVSPQYMQDGSLKYTTARQRANDSERGTSESDAEIRAWYDNNLMIRLPEGLKLKRLDTVRNISVRTVLVGDDEVEVSDPNYDWLAPHPFHETFVLAPAADVKAVIRSWVDE